MPGVAAVEADGVVTLDATQPSPPSYGVDRIDQRNRPLSSTYEYTATGAGVRAYIIDTGIQPPTSTSPAGSSPGHQHRRRLHRAPPTATATARTSPAPSAATPTASPRTSRSSRVRVFGLPGNSTATARSSPASTGSTAHHQAGQPAVANMSLGGGASAALDTAVRNMITDGVTVTVAAGNDERQRRAAVRRPPSPTAVTVRHRHATTPWRRSPTSGTCVDVNAPGV